MNTQKIIDLAHELQAALPFDSNGIKSEQQYKEALALTDKLTDVHDDNNTILYEILWPAISQYEDSDPEFAHFNKRMIELDLNESVRYAKVVISAVEQFGSELKAAQWLRIPILALGNRRPIDMLLNEADTERVLAAILAEKSSLESK